MKPAKHLTVAGFIFNIIPGSAIGAFGQGTILQVLVVLLFVGFALPCIE